MQPSARLPRSQEVPPLALNRGQQLRRGSLTHTMLTRSHVQDFNYASLLLSLWMLKRARARAYCITFPDRRKKPGCLLDPQRFQVGKARGREGPPPQGFIL